MEPPSPSSQHPVPLQDVGVLVGLLAIIEGELMAGATNPEISDRFAQRFLDAGLMARPPTGTLPTPGQVRLAVSDLGQRLRYALGEYTEAPEPARAAVAHVLRFDTHDAARRCAVALRGDGHVDVQERADRHTWLLLVVCPELPPDEGFSRRRRALTESAVGFGGSYGGYQGPPPSSPTA